MLLCAERSSRTRNAWVRPAKLCSRAKISSPIWYSAHLLVIAKPASPAKPSQAQTNASWSVVDTQPDFGCSPCQGSGGVAVAPQTISYSKSPQATASLQSLASWGATLARRFLAAKRRDLAPSCGRGEPERVSHTTKTTMEAGALAKGVSATTPEEQANAVNVVQQGQGRPELPSRWSD